jgi:hypothetical protein
MKRRKERRGVVAAPKTNELQQIYLVFWLLQPFQLASTNGEVKGGAADRFHQRDAFAVRGHDAWSCDLLQSERNGKHIQDDVLKHLGDGWDLMVADPPCTRLCNSGVRWLSERNLWADMRIAAEFFLSLLNAPVPRRALENPIPHKYAREIMGPYQQRIHPWLFGHPESKTTCLWLRNLPPLMAKLIETGRGQRCFRMPPSEIRSRERSRTFPGIALAMAE